MEGLAPRPWCKRVLLSFVMDGTLTPYSAEGEITGRVPISCLLDSERFVPADGDVFWEAVKEEWGAFAPRPNDVVDGWKCKVTGSRWGKGDLYGPREFSYGYFAYANEINWEDGSLYVSSLFPAEVDRELFALEDSLFNQSGRLEFPRFAWLDYEIRLNVICFDRSVIEAISLGSGNQSASLPDRMPAPRRGGRRGAQHGEAIASAAVRLAKLSGPELRRYTSDSLALELAEEYKRLGEIPPSDENLKRYAQGLLRVVRN